MMTLQGVFTPNRVFNDNILLVLGDIFKFKKILKSWKIYDYLTWWGSHTINFIEVDIKWIG